MITTIIKCKPGAGRGKLRGYTITQVRDGVRTSIDVIAANGRAAIDAIRGINSKSQQVAA